jgi:flagellin-like hook-associated protein FlgL
MVERLSSGLMFSMLSRNIFSRQDEIFKLSQKINSGLKFNNAYDDPVGITGAVDTKGRILSNNQLIRDRNTAISDLEAQEIALRTMNDLMDRVHEIAIRGSNASASAEERILLKDEVRSIGETIIQLSNSRVGNKYIFSGIQSNLQTLRLNNGAPFSDVVYKHNQDNSIQRTISGIPVSIDLKDVLVSSSGDAILRNNVINPIAPINGDMDFEIHDGSGNIFTFTANILVGDGLTDIINKINTAYNGAGGIGSIASESPAGYLTVNTGDIPGSSANSNAKIILLKTSTTELTNQIGVNKQNYRGKEQGILRTLADLESALSSNDEVGVRNMLDLLKFNSREINKSINRLGLLVAQAERFNVAAEDLDIKLQSDLSIQQDLDMIDANIRMSNAQVALQTSVQTASNFFSQSITSFLM